MSADVLSDEKTGPRSIGDRAENGDSGVPEEELFPKGYLPGDGVAPQSYVKKTLPNQLEASLSKAAVPLRGTGLPDANRFGRAVVTYLPGPKHELPLREDKADPQKVTGIKTTVDLRVVHVANANDTPDLLRTEFEVLLADDAKAAAALLDELQSMAAAALG